MCSGSSLKTKINGLANLPYAKRLEILGLDALQTTRIKSDLAQCYSIVHGQSCMKPADCNCFT